MGTVLEFGLLGPLTVGSDGVRLPVRPAKQRVLLASLLVNANRVVTADELIAWLWDSAPPGSARGALQTHVMRLRQMLAGLGRRAPVVTCPGGYLIEVDGDALDLHRFEGLVRCGKAAWAEGDHARAAALLRQGLDLWRGEPLQDVPSETLRRDVVPALEERRLLAIESRIDADLALGRYGELAPQLADLTARHPFRERLWAQRLLALYRCGRQAEALECYRTVREILADELGIDPGPELQQLHHAVLANNPGLAGMPSVPSRQARQVLLKEPGGQVGRRPAATPGQPPPAVLRTARPMVSPPRQLLSPPRGFTGRGRELAMLTDALDARPSAGSGPDPGGTMMILTISGTGGVGKTWLALHWSHQNLARFPDGQLYVNLRGFDLAGDPVPPEQAVRDLLAALGVGQEAIPVALDAQTALYRSLTAGKQMLIVVDNARDTAQVAPLLPGSPTCTVLVTSRRRLGALVTAYGAVSVDLDVLDDASARALLSSHLGRGRVEAEPAAVTDLLRYCAGLPLALSITAARAVTNPGLPLGALADELRDASARLDALDAGELTANLRAVFATSKQALKPATAAAFGLLGLMPGPDISFAAAARLTGAPAGSLRGLLGELTATHLVQEHSPGRYRMHDLIRLYAAEQAHRDNPPEGTTTALRRLADYYLHTAYTGQRLLYPFSEPFQIDPPAAGETSDQLADADAAMAWFDQEQACLLRAQQVFHEQGWDTAVWQLAWTMSAFQQRRGRLHDHLAAWRAGLAATERLGDPVLQSHAHRFLGNVLTALGLKTETLSHLRQALELAESAGDLTAAAHAHHGLARAWSYQHNIEKALHHATRALGLFQAARDLGLEGRELNNVGWYRAKLGHYQQARKDCERALAVCGELEDRMGESAALDSIGYIAQHTGHRTQALRYYEQALSLRRELGNFYAAADTLERLGEAHFSLGHHTQARNAWEQALEFYLTQHRAGDIFRIQARLNSLPAHS